MAEERVRCTSSGCRNTILPATAARTGGICRPCEQRIAQQEHEAYVRANQREVDPFAGVTDPVEVVRLLTRRVVHDELVVLKPFGSDVGEYVASLPAHEVQRIIALAISLLAEEGDGAAARCDQAEKIARCLAAFTTADLSGLQRAVIESGCFWPPLVFRGAPPYIRDRLITLAEEDAEARNRTLIALAWIGDERVVELFAAWRSTPPAWAASLYVPPHEYAQEGGWQLDGKGRRTLFSADAYALVRATAKDSGPPVVEVMGEARGRCGWCRGRLTTLFRFERSDARLAPLALPPRVVTCTDCLVYGPLFMTIDAKDNAEWHSANRKPAHFSKTRGERPDAYARLVLGERRHPLHSADQFLPTTFSQIGGAPTWIQDAVYPHCPGCGRTMCFIAQASLEDLDEFGDGMLYAFWCAPCRVTAVSHQHS